MVCPEIPIPQTVVEEVNKLRGYWKTYSSRIPSDSKDQIGKLYLTHILGFPKVQAEIYADYMNKGFDELRNDDRAVLGKLITDIGERQEGINLRKPTLLPEFWQEVKALEPRLVPTKGDLDFLINRGKPGSTLNLILSLDSDFVENPSLVLKGITTSLIK